MGCRSASGTGNCSLLGVAYVDVKILRRGAQITFWLFSTLQVCTILETAPMNQPTPQKSGGPSWGALLALLVLAISVAVGIAYWMLYPFFHHRG
jgi:hypothetical protein